VTLVLGALTLNRVREFRVLKEARFPRHKIVGKSTGTLDADAFDRIPDTYELVCEVNDTDRKTLQDTYLNTTRDLSDSDSGLSEVVHVEKTECEYLVGHSYDSDFCWRCTVNLVISNS